MPGFFGRFSFLLVPQKTCEWADFGHPSISASTLWTLVEVGIIVAVWTEMRKLTEEEESFGISPRDETFLFSLTFFSQQKKKAQEFPPGDLIARS